MRKEGNQSMKKIISLILSAAMLISALPVISLAEETQAPEQDVVVETQAQLPEPIEVTYDTYTSSYKEVADADKANVLLTGSVYDRYALFEFDISSFTGKTFGGNIFAVTLRNTQAGSRITLYSYDKNAKNFKESLEFVTVATLAKAGKQRCEFVASSYIEKLLANGETTACFALKSDSKVLSVFASETPKQAEKPSLYCTEGEAYVKGQKDYDYPDVSVAEIEAELKKTVAKGHPWLMANKEDFDRARALYKAGEPNMLKIVEGTRKRADNFLSMDIQYLPPVNESYISQGVYTKDTIIDCCFMYQLTGEAKYADRAIREAMYYATLESWGTAQMLDNNQTATAVAVVYDWLYDYLSQGERDSLVEALKSLHLDALHDMFLNPTKSDYQITFYLFYFANNNHAILDNTSTFMQALAIADIDTKFSAEVMKGTLECLEAPFDTLYPDSAFPEGVGYWSFAGPYMARMFSSMESAFGHWFGYENCKAIANFAEFPLYAQSNITSMIYCDAGKVKDVSHEKFYYGILTNNDSLMAYSLKNDDSAYPLVALWYDPEIDYNAELDLSLDKHFRETELAVMRDTFEGVQENWGGMAVNASQRGHHYLNNGTIALHALGEEWIAVPGRDNYNLPEYWITNPGSKRWKYYFARAEGNNCVVINPSADAGQEVYSESKINLVSEPRGAYMVSDLTDAYRQQVKSYTRAFGLLDDRSKFVLQDELVMMDKSEMYSFINFLNCDFEITEDNDVIVSKNNKKIFVNIICDQPYDVSIMRSKGLPTSDIAPGERRINDIKKIAIHLKDVTKANIRVEMTPVLFEEEIEAANKSNEIIPIAEWSVPEGEIDTPRVDTILFDGKEPENFSPYNRTYVFAEGEVLPAKVEAKVDESKYTVSVTKTNITPNDLVWKITVTDKNDPANFNTYIVCNPPYVEVREAIDLSKLKKLSISSVRASDDDGNVPSNTIDADMSTRWSSEGESTITFELDKSYNINCVGISYYEGDKRAGYFDLEFSEDGKKWTSVGTDLESSGKTLDMEYYETNNARAKYVRIHGYGNSSNGWNSITEVEIYSK